MSLPGYCREQQVYNFQYTLSNSKDLCMPARNSIKMSPTRPQREENEANNRYDSNEKYENVKENSYI